MTAPRSDHDAHLTLVQTAQHRASLAHEIAAFARGRAHARQDVQQRRTNRRLAFIAALVGVMAFAAGYASAPRAAEAVTWHLVAHGISHHTGSRTDTQVVTSDRRTPDRSPRLRLVDTEIQVPYQERNWGAGLRAAVSPDLSLQVGGYRNSYDRTSLYALADYTPLRAGPLAAGAFAGVASGYDAGTFAAGLLARLQVDRASATLRYLPRVSSHQTGATVALELGWRV